MFADFGAATVFAVRTTAIVAANLRPPALAARALALHVDADGWAATVFARALEPVVRATCACFAQTLAHVVLAQLELCRRSDSLLLAANHGNVTLIFQIAVGHIGSPVFLFVVYRDKVQATGNGLEGHHIRGRRRRFADETATRTVSRSAGLVAKVRLLSLLTTSPLGHAYAVECDLGKDQDSKFHSLSCFTTLMMIFRSKVVESTQDEIGLTTRGTVAVV